MAQWAVLIGAERYEAERLYHHDNLELAGAPVVPPVPVPGEPSAPAPAPGDEVLVVAERPEPVVVALGRITAGRGGAGPLVVAYTRRCFDDPRPAGDIPLTGTLASVDSVAFRAVADGLAATAPDLRTWLVSVDLPIEADSPAEAVRRFWSYVRELGPRELPAFVSPTGDELAMQAFVLGEEANLDPEEDAPPD